MSSRATALGLLSATLFLPGIDFTGGVQVMLRSDAPKSLAALRADIGAAVPGDASLEDFGDPTEALKRKIREYPAAH
ncbi:MAG: hypothetical protein JJT95_18665 [Pararhodobacter sp.]|nr:hypothetical protein [Pararhodobacter sp.]